MRTVNKLEPIQKKLKGRGLYQYREVDRTITCGIRACFQVGRVALASGLTLPGGQKIALVYKQIS